MRQSMRPTRLTRRVRHANVSWSRPIPPRLPRGITNGGTGQVQKIQVLLVERNLADVERVRVCLKGHGLASFDVDHAVDIAAALGKLSAAPFDVVLLEVEVSHLSLGTDAISAIHQIDPRIPVVVLSAQDDASLGVEAVARRAQDFIPKTQLEALLARTIFHAIERQRSDENAKL